MRCRRPSRYRIERNEMDPCALLFLHGTSRRRGSHLIIPLGRKESESVGVCPGRARDASRVYVFIPLPPLLAPRITLRYTDSFTRISILTSMIDRSHQATHHRQPFSQTVRSPSPDCDLRISFPSSTFTCSSRGCLLLRLSGQ